MTSINENNQDKINIAIGKMVEAENAIRKYTDLLKNGELVLSKDEAKKIFNLVSGEMRKLQKIISKEQKRSSNELHRQIKIVNKICDSYFENSLLEDEGSPLKSEKINYLHLLLKKISQIKNLIIKLQFIIINEFIVVRTGFFFAFKENKKNTP